MVGSVPGREREPPRRCEDSERRSLFAPQSLGRTYPSLSHAVWVMFPTVST